MGANKLKSPRTNVVQKLAGHAGWTNQRTSWPDQSEDFLAGPIRGHPGRTIQALFANTSLGAEGNMTTADILWKLMTTADTLCKLMRIADICYRQWNGVGRSSPEKFRNC